jgi:glycosyltransferase involved in cell wall biosynthesis
MMRVAVFTDNDFDKINGVTTTLKALLRHAPDDIRPRIYTLADLEIDEPQYLALAAAGVPIPYYAEMRMYVPRIGEIRRRLRADAVRVIHLTTPGPVGLAARYLSRRLGLPLVGSYHTQLAEYTRRLSGSDRLGRLMGQYLRWVYGRCEQVLVPSVDTGLRLEEEGWDGARLGVWARGIDTATFSPDRRSAALREKWRVSDSRPAVLYAGRLSVEKGLDLIGPVLSLLQRHNIAHRMIFVGEGPMTATLRDRFPDAVLTGPLHHDAVAAAMASADVFLFPSETDTAGNVVLEAQACGLPVLVSNVGGPQENLLRGASGFVCRAGDTLDFGSRLSQLLGQPVLRREMAAAARQYATTRSWPMMLQPVFAAYRAAVRVRARSTDMEDAVPAAAAGA